MEQATQGGNMRIYKQTWHTHTRQEHFLRVLPIQLIQSQATLTYNKTCCEYYLLHTRLKKSDPLWYCTTFRVTMRCLLLMNSSVVNQLWRASSLSNNVHLIPNSDKPSSFCVCIPPCATMPSCWQPLILRQLIGAYTSCEQEQIRNTSQVHLLYSQ